MLIYEYNMEYSECAKIEDETIRDLEYQKKMQQQFNLDFEEVPFYTLHYKGKKITKVQIPHGFIFYVEQRIPCIHGT